MAVKKALGTNTPDPLALFGGWEQGKLAGVIPGLDMGSGNGFVGGFGQPDFLQQLTAQAGMMPQAPAQAPPAAPTTSTPVPVAAPASSPAMAPAGAKAAASAPVPATGETPATGPNLQQLPDAPTPADPLTPPVYDEAKAKADAQRALNISLLPSALATLFNIHGGDFARAQAPALMAAALQASDEQSQDNYKRALQAFGVNQDQQNLADARAQRTYNQKTNQVMGANEIAQKTFDNVLKVESLKQESELKNRALDQKDVAAQLRDSAAYRRAILALDPASQEAELSSDKAKALGIRPFYDEDGNYVPLRLSKDVTAEEKARIARMTGENQNAYRDILGVVAQGNLGNNTARTDSTIKKNDASITHMENQDEVARKKLELDQQRINILRQNSATAARKANAAIGKMAKGGDPKKAAQQLTALMSAARARQLSAAKILDDPTAGQELRDAAQDVMEEQEKAIASYTALRDSALQDAQAMPQGITPFQARAMSNRALVTTPGGSPRTIGPAPVRLPGQKAKGPSIGARYNQSAVPPLVAKPLPSAASSSFQGTKKTPAPQGSKKVVPGKVYTASELKGFTEQQLKQIMLGTKP